jgi:hypothetical protein
MFQSQAARLAAALEGEGAIDAATAPLLGIAALLYAAAKAPVRRPTNAVEARARMLDAARHQAALRNSRAQGARVRGATLGAAAIAGAGLLAASAATNTSPGSIVRSTVLEFPAMVVGVSTQGDAEVAPPAAELDSITDVEAPRVAGEVDVAEDAPPMPGGDAATGPSRPSAGLAPGAVVAEPGRPADSNADDPRPATVAGGSDPASIDARPSPTPLPTRTAVAVAAEVTVVADVAIKPGLVVDAETNTGAGVIIGSTPRPTLTPTPTPTPTPMPTEKPRPTPTPSTNFAVDPAPTAATDDDADAIDSSTLDTGRETGSPAVAPPSTASND